MDEGAIGAYKLVIHCGGCMIDPQKMRARVRETIDSGTPITNYGLLLSYCHDPAALERVLAPWQQ